MARPRYGALSWTQSFFDRPGFEGVALSMDENDPGREAVGNSSVYERVSQGLVIWTIVCGSVSSHAVPQRLTRSPHKRAGYPFLSDESAESA